MAERLANLDVVNGELMETIVDSSTLEMDLMGKIYQREHLYFREVLFHALESKELSYALKLIKSISVTTISWLVLFLFAKLMLVSFFFVAEHAYICKTNFDYDLTLYVSSLMQNMDLLQYTNMFGEDTTPKPSKSSGDDNGFHRWLALFAVVIIGVEVARYYWGGVLILL
jgi:hypothetical protein